MRGLDAALERHGFSPEEIAAMEASPGWRYHGRIKRLKAVTVQILTRDITNSTNPTDAAKLLFTEHARVRVEMAATLS